MQQAGLQGSGIFHTAYHWPEKTLFAYHSDAHKERAVTVQGATNSSVPRALLDQAWLAGDERFVHVRLSRYDLTVYRHPTARADAHQIVDAHVFKRHVYFFAVPHDMRNVGLKV